MGHLPRSLLLSTLGLVSTLGLTLSPLGDAPAIAQNKGSGRPTTWGRIRELFGQRDRKGGSKGAFCPVAPTALGYEGQVWSQSPLVAWRGELGRLEVRSGDGEVMLWRWEGPQREAEREVVLVEGELLQSGETYELWMFLPGTSAAASPSLAVSFSVLPEMERQAVGQELERLTQHYEQFGFSPEQLARYRTGFFAQRSLWADALQEMRAVEGPSPELRQVLVGLERDLCDPS